jgi:uncharacterized protein with NAD-binding domain and iron-sulfur cluster
MPTDTPAGETKLRVAIVGGGCAALAAAFELTRPERGERFEVTVYQMGFRLGGKGASGRGASGRIEEHGLHLWMGYYENAFRLMRDCFAELGRENPDALDFERAFSPAELNGAMDYSPASGWLPWKVAFPAMPGVPGDPDPSRFGVSDYLVRAARLLETLLATLASNGLADDAAPARGARGAAPSVEALSDLVTRLAKFGALAGWGALIEAVHWLGLVLESLPRYPQSVVARLLDVITELARKNLERVTASDDAARRLWEVAELILATLRGAIRFRLAFDPRGLDAIDDYDCREWLRLNGASEGAINGAFIRALYDLAFAYEGGDPARPAIAAGSALRGAFRAFFTYRGAFFWRMHGGMGDIVFAPLYQVLRRRGVRFEFFHKLTNVGTGEASDPSPHVATLDFDVQARTLSGGEYLPLVDVRGLPCWPSRPDFVQLAGGAELAAQGIDFESQWDDRRAARRTLRVGSDFDFVVLGVGLGVIPHVCAGLLERHARFREMVEHVKSVPTQAFQLWLERDLAELGWKAPSINLSGFVEPFDTWADMTHLASREAWARPPRTIAYFCSVLEDTDAPRAREDARDFVAQAGARVRDRAVEFLRRDMPHLWPLAQTSAHEFDWGALAVADPSQAETRGVARFESQFWTANVRPSDRYSQALPGSTKYRISPLDRSYDNLTLTGDFTNSSLNMGCVEGAVMSGLLAAHALSGCPELSAIVGYDHP